MGVVRTEEDDGDVLVRAVLARFFNILARKSGVRWIFGLYVLEIWLECVFFITYRGHKWNPWGVALLR